MTVEVRLYDQNVRQTFDPITLEFDETKALLQEVVDERGEDFIFGDECQYQKNGVPSCLVGRVLAKKGASMDLLYAADHLASGDSTVGAVVSSGLIATDQRTAFLLGQAQALQDDRVPYGFVLREALESAELADKD